MTFNVTKILNESRHAAEFIVSEDSGFRSRKAAKIAQNAVVVAGAVLGQVLAAAAPVAGTNTGNGVITVGAAIGPNTVEGTYKLVLVAASANAGTFNFYAPDGTLIRQITVGGGATTSDHLTITAADGATDFVIGDSFTIAVAGGVYKPLAPAGTDGTQIASALLYSADVYNTDADTAVTVLYRNVRYTAGEIVWPAGITTPQKNLAIAQLASRAIEAQ